MRRNRATSRRRPVVTGRTVNTSPVRVISNAIVASAYANAAGIRTNCLCPIVNSLARATDYLLDGNLGATGLGTSMASDFVYTNSGPD